RRIRRRPRSGARGESPRLGGQARLARRAVLQPPRRERDAADHSGAQPDGLLRYVGLRHLRTAGRSDALGSGDDLRVLRTGNLQCADRLRAALAAAAADGDGVRIGDRERQAAGRARRAFAGADSPRARRRGRRARLLPLEPDGQLRVGAGLRAALGLHRVDFVTYERTATEGATVVGEISTDRRISAALRETYGGLGPMSAEA